ncbi:RDD family protein [Mycolicibacterium elephantis]|uniref:RDD family protein n=1 Tax=Mycolicibacterium elephantis TaxID=81858 RepID=UPI003A85ABC6
MTDQPPTPGDYPPPSGGQPPPPAPQAGGYPPPASGGFSPGAQAMPPMMPKEAYTPWFTRVLAWIIDYIPFTLILGIGFAMLAGTRETACLTDVSEYELGEFCATGASTLGQASVVIASLVALAYLVWNLGYRQGRTGSSIGKSILKFKVVTEKTGQPMGFGPSVLREFIYLIAYFACGLLWLIAVLFPLWDSKRQTLVDKIVSTICLPL